MALCDQAEEASEIRRHACLVDISGNWGEYRPVFLLPSCVEHVEKRNFVIDDTLLPV